jgi:hypothetical protein
MNPGVPAGPRRLSAPEAQQSLSAHAAAKGAELRLKYGPQPGGSELGRILLDREFVRYPCELRFEAGPLLAGEFAYPAPNGARPEEGYVLYVHPHFQGQPEQVAFLVFYQLAAINYGPFASAADAEAFGAAALGISKDEYYRALCELADQVGEGPGA